MQWLSRLKLTFIAITGLMISCMAVAKSEPPEVTEEGLLLVKDSRLALVYAAPGASLEGYKRVILLDAHVAFKKNWQRDQNRNSVRRVSDNDMKKMTTRLVSEFNEVFTEVLQEDGGYEIVGEAAEDVLILRPAIINLDVIAPDTMASTGGRSYAESAGEMTLYLEVFDSQTNALIAKGMDRRADRSTGWMTWQTSVSNRSAAKRILKGWAEVLRDALDEANTATKGNGSD